ncbi:hypothetical protein GCM10007112_09580 [Vulcanisaeta souniana JCM 11219]|uniref:Uncharacterized protein n=1 Tax=Vulcanisaeta souniana JCM 11219 TaxID=1293586 RepID=A0A830E5Z9_9CREN|nr:hypothetical protein GCM10007112_09580 [Vulcanisaeta souniana JCM 11219]
MIPAHLVVVSLGTGLGDVIAEYYGGGIELRLRVGAPGIGILDNRTIPSPQYRGYWVYGRVNNNL